MINGLIPILVLGVFFTAGFALISTVAMQKKFLQQYRDLYNPEFPLLPDELREKMHADGTSIFDAFLMLVSSTPRRLALYWKRYPKNNELNELAKLIRKRIALAVLTIAVGMVLMALLSYKISHP